jgi:hypothetical protein
MLIVDKINSYNINRIKTGLNYFSIYLLIIDMDLSF